MDEFRLFPEQASNLAGEVDALYLFLWALTAFWTGLIFVMIVYLGLKYRRRSEAMPPEVHGSLGLELGWTILPLVIVLGIFGWSAVVYVRMTRMPAGAMEIYVIGKQWMWKAQHPSGAREINELHVPLGRPIKLTMTSQDTIHSYFIPAFRVKQDVLPGRYSYQWFTPTKLGEYRLFCTEYCGTQHSGMIGKVVVMEPAKYEAWLTGAAAGGDEPLDRAGARLFTQYACHTCHGQQAPTMAGLYGSQRQLADGTSVVADDAYLRESILNSPAKLVAGYPPLMPSYRGQLSEEQLVQLIEYIKSLKVPQRNY
jgi:cytochrome c oxidase subunit 2